MDIPFVSPPAYDVFAAFFDGTTGFGNMDAAVKPAFPAHGAELRIAIFYFPRFNFDIVQQAEPRSVQNRTAVPHRDKFRMPRRMPSALRLFRKRTHFECDTRQQRIQKGRFPDGGLPRKADSSIFKLRFKLGNKKLRKPTDSIRP